MEIQLEESKFELSSLNEQLMEAIQQKMALSQELEQWQVSQLDNYINIIYLRLIIFGRRLPL